MRLCCLDSEFTVTKTTNDKDEEVTITKVKTENRTKALQILSQHFGLIRKQVDFNFSGSVKVEQSVAPIDSIPRWLQMVLLAVMSGKEISKELQEKLSQELEGIFDPEYNVLDDVIDGSYEETETDFYLVTEFE